MAAANAERPNILFICTDQQSAHMMSCAGNRWVNTPAMDSLAATGTRFTRAYCTDPVCVPSRFSMFTGLMPSAIGLRGNGSRHIESVPDAIKAGGMGYALREAGYDAIYGGKEHLPRTNAVELGFEMLTRDERDGLAFVCADFLRREHENPFLLVASFINPHDICYMAIRESQADDMERALVRNGGTELRTMELAMERPRGMSDETFFSRYCPPAPANFAPQEDEPEMLRRLLSARPFRERARDVWPEETWRLHRWTYARLTEYVDAQIGRVLHALRDGPNSENTVVVFTSDHGDHDGSHRMEHKTAFYEEAQRVPFIISQPGVTPGGAVDNRLVSTGLDLIPTLCDYAGVPAPEGLDGRSVRMLAEGRAPAEWRTYVPIESEVGHAVVSEHYCYALYDEGANREQMYDLVEDPGQTRNAAQDPRAGNALATHREIVRKRWPELNVPTTP